MKITSLRKISKEKTTEINYYPDKIQPSKKKVGFLFLLY